MNHPAETVERVAAVFMNEGEVPCGTHVYCADRDCDACVNEGRTTAGLVLDALVAGVPEVVHTDGRVRIDWPDGWTGDTMPGWFRTLQVYRQNDVLWHLVRVLRTGICGTDLHIQSWDDWAARTITTPIVVGHEFVGEVAALGAAVEEGTAGLSVGDLVGGEGHVVCGTCRNCMAGRRHLCDRGLHDEVAAGVARNRFMLVLALIWVTFRYGSTRDA